MKTKKLASKSPKKGAKAPAKKTAKKPVKKAAKKVVKKTTKKAPAKPKAKEDPMTRIFSYKGLVGIKGGSEMLAKPGNGNLGCVVESKFVRCTKEALELLQKVKRGRDAIGDVMIFGEPKKFTVGWLGGPWTMIDPEEAESDRDYNPSLLSTNIEEMEAPEEFKKAVDEVR